MTQEQNASAWLSRGLDACLAPFVILPNVGCAGFNTTFSTTAGLAAGAAKAAENAAPGPMAQAVEETSVRLSEVSRQTAQEAGQLIVEGGRALMLMGSGSMLASIGVTVLRVGVPTVTLPWYLGRQAWSLAQGVGGADMARLDQQILNALTKGQLLTPKDLAERLGVLAKTLKAHLQGLEESGQLQTWNGYYGRTEDVLPLNAIGSQLLDVLTDSSFHPLQQLADDLNASMETVAHSLALLQSIGQVQSWQGYYGLPERVQNASQASDSICDALNNAGNPQTLQQIADQLGLDLSVVHDCLGVLEGTGETGTWRGRCGTRQQVEMWMQVEKQLLETLAADGTWRQPDVLAGTINTSETLMQNILNVLKEKAVVITRGDNDNYGLPGWRADVDAVNASILKLIERQGRYLSLRELVDGTHQPLALVREGLYKLDRDDRIRQRSSRYGLAAW